MIFFQVNQSLFDRYILTIWNPFLHTDLKQSVISTVYYIDQWTLQSNSSLFTKNSLELLRNCLIKCKIAENIVYIYFKIST